MDRYERIQRLIRQSMLYAKDAHDCVFDKSVSDSVAMAYLNLAASKIATAESFYYSNLEDLEHSDIEEIFAKFDTFAREMLSNYRTDHSHQWTDIEYEALKAVFDNSVCAFPAK